MKAVFLETSAVVKLYVPEVGSAGLRGFLSDATHVVISRLTVPEFASAVLRRRREGGLSLTDADLILTTFDSDLPRFTVAPLDDALALEARALLAKHSTVPLRTLDALQLACALRFSRVAPGAWHLATSDRRLLAIAPAESFTPVDPEALP